MEKRRAGTVIEVRKADRDAAPPVEVVDGEDLQARYDHLLELVVRMGRWLAGPQAALLQQEIWEEWFGRYHRDLLELRRLGDQLRPLSLRDRGEVLAGDALASEVRELFAG